MDLKNLVGLMMSLVAVGGAPVVAQSATVSDPSRVFLQPINIESCNARNRTATLVYVPTMSNPVPDLGGASTSPEAVVIATDSSTLLTLPLTSNARVMRIDEEGKMRGMSLKAASAALSGKLMTLRAEFEVAPSGQLVITRLIATPV